MALINCPECGTEISDKAEKCIHCGYINRIVETKNIPKFQKRFKKIIIIIATMIIIAIIALLLINMLVPSLSNEEKLAYENALTMQKMLKSPDSFKLYDEMYVIKCFDEEQNLRYTYTVFEYGGANSYGVTLKSTALFQDDEYIMEFIYRPDNSDYEYLSEKEQSALAEVNWVLFLINDYTQIEPEYEIINIGEYEIINIDVEKISKEMNLND